MHLALNHNFGSYIFNQRTYTASSSPKPDPVLQLKEDSISALSTDIAYSFYTSGLPAPFVMDPTVATEMQGYLTRFARTGDPNAESHGVIIPENHLGEIVLDIKEGGFTLEKDDMANERCEWWAKNIGA